MNYGKNNSHLTHCILVDSSSVTCWTSPFVILGVSSLFRCFNSILMENPISNNVDPDQMPHYVASDLGLHCLPMTFYGFPGKTGLTVQSNLS